MSNPRALAPCLVGPGRQRRLPPTHVFLKKKINGSKGHNDIHISFLLLFMGKPPVCRGEIENRNTRTERRGKKKIETDRQKEENGSKKKNGK